MTALKARESRKRGIGAAVGRHCGDGGKQWRVLSPSAPWTAVTREKGHLEGLSRRQNVVLEGRLCHAMHVKGQVVCRLRDASCVSGGQRETPVGQGAFGPRAS